MKCNQSKKLLLIAMCIILSIFGLFFTFFGNSEEKEEENRKEKEESKMMEYEHDYREKQLPESDNESENETYTEGKERNVYFTNTKQIDDSNLPLAVHEVLCQTAQDYLYVNGFENATELRILDGRLEEGKKEISFWCQIIGYEELLKITYQKKESKINFEAVIQEEIKL